MIDASIIQVPSQRNTRDENKCVKAGKTPESWEEKPAKNSQKDKGRLEYTSRLKKWIRRFNGVATEYLPLYLAWRSGLDPDGDSLTPKSCLVLALC